MSILSRPLVANGVARAMQLLFDRVKERRRRSRAGILGEFSAERRELTIPTSVGPTTVVVYRPAGGGSPPVHVNFHGGGYILRLVEDDDPLCRCLAASAGVVVVNVDYAVAPQHPFPAPTRQAFEVVQWVARSGAEHGWDGARLTVGGQSAGAGLAAAVARQALEAGGPAIALQVLHYPPLDLATPATGKRARADRPMLRPWMAEVFDAAYVPDRRQRGDRLVSPAHASDTADLTGIAPALVLTAELDLLRDEGRAYARRLQGFGALRELVDVIGADHGYDLDDHEKARETYSLIARHLRGLDHRQAA